MIYHIFISFSRQYDHYSCSILVVLKKHITFTDFRITYINSRTINHPSSAVLNGAVFFDALRLLCFQSSTLKSISTVMNRITFVTLCFWQVVLKGSCLSNPVPECRFVKVHVILYGYQSPALSPVFFLSFRLALYIPNASSVAENLSGIHEKLYSECLDICKNYENPLISFSNLEKNGK